MPWLEYHLPQGSDKSDKLVGTICIPYKNTNLPRTWSTLSYAGEDRVPPAEDPKAGSWPTYFLKRSTKGSFTDMNGNPIAFRIQQPDMDIDFEGEQLDIVRETLEKITPEQIDIAEYWGTGPATKQWTPIINRLIDTYSISASRAARILASVHAALNDTFVVTWYFKFLWQVARPNQLDQQLATILCTPRHPSYPSGHAAVAGCAETVLRYFFEAEADQLHSLAEECAQSRLYAGVHYPIDNQQGLRLGRHIGEIVVHQLEKQRDRDSSRIDYSITESLNAQLPPPPYEQVIPFDREMKCDSLILSPQQDCDLEGLKTLDTMTTLSE